MAHTTITLGGGCFWCLEAIFLQVDGVVRAESGYAGGHLDNPDYASVCGGGTGHAEVVQVGFDPEIVSLRQILEIFFVLHDPTTLNRQGNDVGTQYRSVILWHGQSQRDTAEAVIRELEQARVWPGTIVTQLRPLDRFWPAEEYHRDYYARNATQPYCQVVINPKLAKLRARFAEHLAGASRT